MIAGYIYYYYFWSKNAVPSFNTTTISGARTLCQVSMKLKTGEIAKRAFRNFRTDRGPLLASSSSRKKTAGRPAFPQHHQAEAAPALRRPARAKPPLVCYRHCGASMCVYLYVMLLATN
jgi:hypothetical protein